MSSPAGKVGQDAPQHPDEAEVKRELARILESASFRGSKRCQDFLSYVVTQTLHGSPESLKERTLAVEVFGRKADADLGDDSIVRVGAREVRKRLAQYYVTEGEHHHVRIDLPPGSYVAAFQFHGAEEADVVPALTTASAVAAELQTSVTPSRRRQRLWLTVGAVVTAAALVGAWTFIKGRPTDFDTFWAPILAGKAPVNIAVAHPIVYHPSQHALDLDNEINGRSALPIQRPLQVPSQKLSGSDFVPVLDQYAGIGDTIAAARVFSLCEHRNKAARIRLASKLDFADLRECPAVLIGGSFTNRWTLELSRSFRFSMTMCSGKPCIVDSTNKQEWRLAGKTEDGRSSEDYILIGRLPNSPTGGTVVFGAGLTVNGTAEAGRILAEPDALTPVLRQLPAGWKDHNLLLVLHSRVLGDTMTAPDLIAHHIW